MNHMHHSANVRTGSSTGSVSRVGESARIQLGKWEAGVGRCSAGKAQNGASAHHCKAMVNEGFEKMLEKDGQSYLEALPALLCDELKAKGDVVVAGVCSK